MGNGCEVPRELKSLEEVKTPHGGGHHARFQAAPEFFAFRCSCAQELGMAPVRARECAELLDAPIVFTKTLHAKMGRPLMLNGEELDALIRETLAIKFVATNEISTLGKKVIKSRFDRQCPVERKGATKRSGAFHGVRKHPAFSRD